MYSCSNDVTIQYSYYEVGTVAVDCGYLFDEFIYYNPKYVKTLAEANAQIPPNVPGFSVASYTWTCYADETFQRPYYETIVDIFVACPFNLQVFLDSYVPAPFMDGKTFRTRQLASDYIFTSPDLASVRSENADYGLRYFVTQKQRLCDYGQPNTITYTYFEINWV